MNYREIFQYVMDNNIGKILEAIKEPRLTHKAEYIASMMNENDREAVQRMNVTVEHKMKTYIQLLQENEQVRQEAYRLLENGSHNTNITIMNATEVGLEQYKELCIRFFEIDDISLDNMHQELERAKRKRIKTLIATTGMKDILGQMDREMDVIQSDAQTMQILMDSYRKLEQVNGDVGIIVNLLTQSLRNLFYDKRYGKFNEKYFEEVKNIHVILRLYLKEDKDGRGIS